MAAICKFTKAQKAVQAIRLIQRNFTKIELLTIFNSNYYSILFYNSDMQLIPSLSNSMKNNLLTASAKPLKICHPAYNNLISYKHLHQYLKQATPSAITRYKDALLRYKTYNSKEQN